MSIATVNATFVEGRDALRLADFNTNARAHACLIWNAFAKRGLGVAASDGGGPTSLAVTVPVECLPEPGSAGMLFFGVALLRALDPSRQRSRTPGSG